MTLPPSLTNAPERFARRNATPLKLLFVAFLVLLLLAPLHVVVMYATRRVDDAAVSAAGAVGEAST
jgi:hypothetical protein